MTDLLILHLATYPEKSKGPVQEKTAQDVRRLVIDLILPHAFVFRPAGRWLAVFRGAGAAS
jgi:hypothetical protein